MQALERIKSLGFSGRHGHPCLYDVISEATKLSKPLSFLEIGVYDGASLFTVLTDSSPNRIVLCDIFNRAYQEMDSWKDQKPGSAQHITDMLNSLEFTGDIQFLIEDSRIAIPKLTGQLFDLIHIDGNHETPYVRADFLHCYPLLKDGGYMVMDDSVWPTVSVVCEEMVKAGMKHILTLRDSESGSSIYQKPTA